MDKKFQMTKPDISQDIARAGALKADAKLVEQIIKPRAPLATGVQEIADALGVHPSFIQRVPHFPYAGILYPHMAVCIYHLVRNQYYITDAEARCNNLIKEFMEERLVKTGPQEYLKIYRQAVTDKTRELVMLRVLVATFQFGKNKMDYLPDHHRAGACEFLKLPTNIDQNRAVEILEEKGREANAEEQILGRLGYLITWRELTGTGYNPELKNNPEDDKVEIFRNVPRDRRGIPLDRSILDEWGREDTDKDIVITDEEGNILGPEPKEELAIEEESTKRPSPRALPLSEVSPVNKNDLEYALEWRGFKYIKTHPYNYWDGPKGVRIYDDELTGVIRKYGYSLTSPMVVKFLKDLDEQIASKGWST